MVNAAVVLHYHILIYVKTSFLGSLALIKGDSIIRLFGENQILRKGEELTFTEVNQIRAKLHYLARLLSQLHIQTDTTMSFSELLRPQFYDEFVNSVLVIRETNKQLALTLGHYIKQICLLNIAQSIKAENKQAEQMSESFLKLYNSSWSATVASSTARLQQRSKLNKAIKLPDTEDLVKLTKFLNLKICDPATNYTMLQKYLMAGIILYNKRRPAEVAEIRISDYQLSLDNQEDRKEILNSLPAEERVVASRFVSQISFMIVIP